MDTQQKKAQKLSLIQIVYRFIDSLLTNAYIKNINGASYGHIPTINSNVIYCQTCGIIIEIIDKKYLASPYFRKKIDIWLDKQNIINQQYNGRCRN